MSGIKIIPKWTMFTAAIGVTPFDEAHTSKNTLELTERILTKFGLRLTDFIGCTTDTASAAFNTFEVIDFIAQLPCFAHLIALLLKHAFEMGLLSSALQGIHDLVVMLKASPKRKSLLKRACEAAMILYLAPILDVITRWNSKEAMVTRIQYLFPALMQISAQDAFSKPADRAKWITSLANAEAGLASLHFVMPFLVETSQWTQILSRRDSPTVSLVRAAAKSIKRSLEKFDRDIKDLPQEPEKAALTEVHIALCFWAFGDETEHNVGYIGDKYTEFWVFRVAEFLDCRTHKTMSFAEKLEVLNDILPDLVPLSAKTVKRSTIQSRRLLSEEEKFLESGTVSQKQPLFVNVKRILHL